MYVDDLRQKVSECVTCTLSLTYYGQCHHQHEESICDTQDCCDKDLSVCLELEAKAQVDHRRNSSQDQGVTGFNVKQE